MRWLVLTTMVLFAATCGQKGPLTHPEPDNGAGMQRILVAQHGCANAASQTVPLLTNAATSHG